MADRLPNGNDETDAAEGAPEGDDPKGGEDRQAGPSKRKQRRARRAAERDHIRQAKAAERDRRRLEKEERRREQRAAKKDKAESGAKSDDEDAKPKAGAKERPAATPEARRERSRRKPAERKRSEGKAPPSKRERGSRPKLSAKSAKAALAKAVPGKKDGSSGDEAKPKRAKGERRPAGTLERAFTRVLAIYGAILIGVIGVVAAALKVLAKPAGKAGRRIGLWIAAVSRLITPTRGLLLAALGCALLLGLSQFVDYRGISIGADAYAPGIQSVAPAPEVERAELGSAHSYLMIPVAILAIAALLVAVRTKRWQLCRLVVLLGLVAIAVALLVDRPAGLDEGDLNRNFTGVEAKLLGGYWMQIFAGAGLALTSFLLAGEIKREAPARARSKAPKSPADADADAEKPRTRGRLRRRNRRRATGAEGAGA
jgi:hypothetical protein